MSSSSIVFLSVLSALNLTIGVLSLAAIGRFSKTHNDVLDVLVESHNWTSARLRDLSDLILKGINVIGQHAAKSSNGADVR